MKLREKKKIIKKFEVEREFFDIDDENKRTNFNLEFSSPEDIFDPNLKSGVPALSDDFVEWLKEALEYSPKKYKIDLNVTFDDLGEYTEEELKFIFQKNMMLEYKKMKRNEFSKNRLAYSLIGVGIVLLISTFTILSMWKNIGLIYEIFSYILDIATTVVFWEALTILLVEGRERKFYLKQMITRFDKVVFKKKDND
ncbi:MAG: hypothetical protein PT941_04035 [Bacillales bacterium]|nr:hypothetical protein [Bacillales bacterium]